MNYGFGEYDGPNRGQTIPDNHNQELAIMFDNMTHLPSNYERGITEDAHPWLRQLHDDHSYYNNVSEDMQALTTYLFHGDKFDFLLLCIDQDYAADFANTDPTILRAHFYSISIASEAAVPVMHGDTTQPECDAISCPVEGCTKAFPSKKATLAHV